MSVLFEYPRELIEHLESLTKPDAEDWVIIPNGKTIYGTAYREDTTPAGNRLVNIAAFVMTRVELKRRVKSLPLANCRPLGCVSVILCADHASKGTTALIGWLMHLAKRRGFSVIVVAGSARTTEAIAGLKQQLAYWASARCDQSVSIH